MTSSNSIEEPSPRNDGIRREIRCQHCHGTGDDPKVDGADCMICFGDGTLEV